MSRRLPPPPGRKLVTALDIGSSKISALIADPGEEGALRILGTGQRESRGVKRGFIADMEQAEAAIREFQSARGMTADGRACGRLLDALRAPQHIPAAPAK